jgi:cysteine-rich repeat protein
VEPGFACETWPSANCQPASCGDGILQGYNPTDNGAYLCESCDDGNQVLGDGCDDCGRSNSYTGTGGDGVGGAYVGPYPSSGGSVAMNVGAGGSNN